MPLVPAKCPECGGNLNIDSNERLGICEFCKKPYIVQEAIQNFNTYYNITNNVSNDIKADVVNVYENKNTDFEIEAGVLKKYKGSETIVSIPNGVFEIANNCFSNLKWLQEVVITEGVQVIDYSAFSFCERLKKVVFPKSLQEIHPSAFLHCENINSVILPEGFDKKIVIHVFPQIFKSEIEDERNEIKKIAEGTILEEFGDDYEIVTLDEIDSHCVIVTQNLKPLWDFITGEYNPISTRVIIEEGERVGTSIYRGEKANEWDGNSFKGIYGHYYAYESFHHSMSIPSSYTHYLGYFKECFTKQEEVLDYMKEKQREFLGKCNRMKICPYCGEPLGFFGGCKNSRCDNTFKQTWVKGRSW